MATVEVLDWIRLGVISLGATIALISYRSGQRQKRLENSLKLLELFHSNLSPSDIPNWVKIFKASSEPTGAKRGHYLSSNLTQIPLKYLFSEGPDDDGATVRISEQIDLVCYESLKGNVELRVIYSNVGQLMDTIYRWFGTEDFFSDSFPSFSKVMNKKRSYLDKLPRKTIAFCE